MAGQAHHRPLQKAVQHPHRHAALPQLLRQKLPCHQKISQKLQLDAVVHIHNIDGGTACLVVHDHKVAAILRHVDAVNLAVQGQHVVIGQPVDQLHRLLILIPGKNPEALLKIAGMQLADRVKGTEPLQGKIRRILNAPQLDFQLLLLEDNIILQPRCQPVQDFVAQLPLLPFLHIAPPPAFPLELLAKLTQHSVEQGTQLRAAEAADFPLLQFQPILGKILKRAVIVPFQTGNATPEIALWGKKLTCQLLRQPVRPHPADQGFLQSRQPLCQRRRS